jgi:putative restriction endonuclease
LITRAQLEAFEFRGQRVRLIAPQQGIWRPAWLECALSILTAYSPSPDLRPYEDDVGDDGYMRYKWRGTDPRAHENRALRRAMEENRQLMWFWGVAPGVYEPIYPVWLVAEEPESHQFVVAVSASTREAWPANLSVEAPFNPGRLYAEAIVRQRLHQRVFRARVLIAYESQCALCRLRHPELLDAAHIRGDALSGEPIVPNGIAMCAIHHRAFDADVLGVRPDYVVEIRQDVLEERDGPTLQHALQGLHKQIIRIPPRKVERPSQDLLEERYQRFRAAS